MGIEREDYEKDFDRITCIFTDYFLCYQFGAGICVCNDVWCRGNVIRQRDDFPYHHDTVCVRGSNSCVWGNDCFHYYGL